MNCRKFRGFVIKEDEIICSDCKIGSHYYCHGMNENVFSKMSKNTKNKWICNDCKMEWENKKGIQINTEKRGNIQQLTDSVQYMSEKLDHFNITVGKILHGIKELR